MGAMIGFRMALVALILAAGRLAVGETLATPPVAERIEHRETWHGDTLVDEYHWLREKANPRVIDYLEAENAYTDSVTRDLKPFEQALYQEMVGRIKQTDLTVPTRHGGYYYYARTEEGKQYPTQCRRKGSLQAPEEVVLDMNELAAGHSFFALGGLVTSDDENLLAYTTDTSGFRQYKLHVKDLTSGRTLPDTAERVTSLEWAPDNKTLYFTTEDPVTKRADRLWRHALGTADSEAVYEEPDELYTLRLGRTRDKKFLYLRIQSSDTSEMRYLAADEPQAGFRVLLEREKGHRYGLEHRDGLFYIRTNKDAQNFRVVTAPVSDPRPQHWRDFVPHRAETMVENVDLFKNFAVVREKSQALSTMRVLDFRNGNWHDITFSEPVYAAIPFGNTEFDTPLYRYTYQSLITPPSVFEYDMESRQRTLLKQQEVLGGYDPANYVSERLWVTARDGARVPLSIVYKKGLRRDGRAPLWLYAYGSYGVGVAPTFAYDRVSLLDRGVTFAIAHIRGGNELGEAWREAGMLMRKKNTFHDFIDCAEHLIKDQWTSPDRLIIEGASAGGLLVGAVVNMRPELFRAALAGVPFVDVMNTMLDATLPLTVGEYLVWGDPHEKAAYDYMKSYSPYDNLARREYPAMLVTAGLNDSQVMYWEPAKYVARMRTLKTDDRPLLLKVNMSAGHGGASGRYDRLKEQAFEYAWLLSQVGVTK
jgi:oligopeptidase B